MCELTTITTSLIALLAQGGSDAAIELSKNAVLNGAGALSKLWRDIFSQAPRAYPLADDVAKQPDNADLKAQLQALVQQTLNEHPGLLQGFNLNGDLSIGEVKADHGAVAVGMSVNSTIQVRNS